MRVACIYLAAIGVAVLVLGRANSQPANEEAIKTAKNDASRALAAAKGFYENELATLRRLHDEGAVSDSRVDQCRETLARLDHDRANLDQRQDDLVKSLREIVAIREQRLNSLSQRNGDSGVLQPERDKAELAAAYARFQLDRADNRREEARRELQRVVDTGDKTLQRLEASGDRNIISEADLEQLRATVEFYRYQLLRLEGKKDEALKALKKHVATRARIFENYEKLRDKQMAGEAETLFAKMQLLRSQSTLAVREENLGAVRKNLAEQVATLEKLVKLHEAGETGPNRRLTVLLKAHVASQKYLLAAATDVKALKQLPFADPLF